MIRWDGCVALFFLLSISRDWRDPTWTSLQSIQNGLSQLVRHQRLTLFGPNIVDIEGKSTISLLVDEVGGKLMDQQPSHHMIDYPPVLRVSSGQHHPLVT